MAESKASDTFKPGDLLNNTYRIEAVLGRGGTSEVYRARSEISKRLVAIKVLRSEFSRNEDFLLLMTREETIREIRHDAVVRYSENHRTSDGLVYLVMDFVDGPALDEKMRSGGMSAEDLLIVAARVSEGLMAAHARNITHRDLSPDNIILRKGIPAEAVIIDFGIAKDDNEGAETIVGNEFAGKYAYAAPEQLSGKSDPRSDIYSLGALLLATFRGATPDVGKNPMEVIRLKGLPLNTEGVPEPLKTLIDRMTQPDPDARLQSAAEVLQFIDPTYFATIPPKRPVTVPPPAGTAQTVAPKSAAPKPATPTPGSAKKPNPAPPLPAGPARKSNVGLILVGIVALLALIGGGGFALGIWQGLLGPSLPVVAPYTLIAERNPDGPTRIVGYAPDQTTLDALNAAMTPLGGEVLVELASGEIAPGWGDGVTALLAAVAPLDSWRLAVSGNDVRVTGQTTDRALQEQLTASLTGDGMPKGLAGSVDIAVVQLFLAAKDLQAAAEAVQDCGPLLLRDPPAAGYGPDTEIVVTGRLADPATRVALFDALTAIAGGRKVIVDTDVLNETLCQIEAVMPDAPPGGFGISFGFGDRPDPNPNGRYFVGENPVIDIEIPADVTDGNLWVSVLDVTGVVFHLLPNLNRPDGSVAALRDGKTGPVTVRVAFGLAEAKDTTKIAFTVDDSSLGKTKVLVIHSDTPLFDGLRPTTESAGGYAQALRKLVEDGQMQGFTLDSRILTTELP